MIRRATLLILLILPVLCRGQVGISEGNSSTRLMVQVTYENDRPVGRYYEVTLTNGSGESIEQTYTNDVGECNFRVSPGNYQVRVTGPDIDEARSDTIFVSHEMHLLTSVRVHQKSSEQQELQAAGKGQGATVAVVDLNVPDKAKQEFQQGQDSAVQNDWKKALKHYAEAIKLYPSYASAYNGMGVAYLRTQDRDHGKQAFEKAIALNDHYELAYLNLSKMEIVAGDYKGADTSLAHALTVDPLSAEGLMLASQVALLLGRYDDAISDAGRVHAMAQHQAYAIVHMLAARAYERKKMFAEAVNELKTYLEEAPNSQHAQTAHAELAALQKQIH